MVISDPQHTECSNLTGARWCNIYAIIESMCPPCYHHNDVHHVLKCMSCHKAIVVITGRAYCFYDCIYIYIIFSDAMIFNDTSY